MKHIVGVDIGGHNIRCALCSGKGEILLRKQAPVDRQAASAEVNVQRVSSLIRQSLEERRLSLSELGCVSLGVPGIVDPDSGSLLAAPNVPHWYNLPLRELLQKELPVPVLLDNDVNLAAVGEHWKGAAAGCRHFFFLALGTGIGGGVFIDGRLHRGAHFAAGEVGYMALDPFSAARRVGDLGWLESVASGLAIGLQGRMRAQMHPQCRLNQLVSEPDQIDSPLVFRAAAEGDATAAQILDEVLEYLSLLVVNISCVLDPELIVFGGGMSAQGEQLLQPIRQRVRAYGFEIPPLQLSSLGENAQLYGAIYTALEQVQGP